MRAATSTSFDCEAVVARFGLISTAMTPVQPIPALSSTELADALTSAAVHPRSPGAIEKGKLEGDCLNTGCLSTNRTISPNRFAG